jgi:hypothetical protein
VAGLSRVFHISKLYGSGFSTHFQIQELANNTGNKLLAVCYKDSS